MMTPHSELMKTILTKSFDADNVKESRKISRKNAQKCVHKLSKQQTE